MALLLKVNSSKPHLFHSSPDCMKHGHQHYKMFKTYFKTAWRFLLKNKTFSFINIFGLAVGTLCCMYILVYVRDQYSYDKHHADLNRIFRLDKKLKTPEGTYNLAISGGSFAPAMKRDFPEIEQFTRVVPLIGIDKHILRYKNNSIYETDPFYVDSTFFDVFSYHFVEGNRESTDEPLFGGIVKICVR